MATINLQNPNTASNSITINGAQLMQSMGASSTASVSISPFSNISHVSNLSPGLSTISLDSYSFWDNPNVKKYEVIESTEDLMALSTTWHRIRMARTPENQGTVFPSTLIDKVLFPEVTSEDRELAGKVRDYYSKKIMMYKLKGQELTNFQRDMNEFIHSDGLRFQEKMIPLVYSLPGFYVNDVAFDAMASEHNTKIETLGINNTKRLNLIEVHDAGRRGRKSKEYWFSDESKHLVKMAIQADNPLLTLLDRFTQDQITVNGMFTKLSRDDRDYFMVSKFKFI
jgi:hypothetical protein